MAHTENRKTKLRIVSGEWRIETIRYSPIAIHLASQFVFGWPGGFSGGPVPDPISNSAVKLPSADGTKSQDLEE